MEKKTLRQSIQVLQRLSQFHLIKLHLQAMFSKKLLFELFEDNADEVFLSLLGLMEDWLARAYGCCGEHCSVGFNNLFANHELSVLLSH